MDLAAGQEFLQAYRSRRVALVPHPDADGLAGAAVLRRCLDGEVTVRCPQKGESIYTAHFARQLRKDHPEAVIVIDQGARDGTLLPGVPTLIVDHHVPSGTPDAVFVTSYPGDPGECAAHICYLLACQPDDSLWLAAVGIIGDFGLQAPFTLLSEAKARFTGTALQETAALINAGRRSSRFDWLPALELLLTAESPRQIASGELPLVARLQEDREEVKQELKRVRRSRPFIASPWAVISFASPCLVHTLVAGSWLGRLKSDYVLAANFGYRPGYVHFSVRSALNIDLRAALRSLAVDEVAGEFGHGHAAATGGAVPREAFLALLPRMGFSPEQIVAIEDTGDTSA